MLKEILASLEGLTDLERAEVLRTLMSGQTVLQKAKTLLGITTEAVSYTHLDVYKRQSRTCAATWESTWTP